ncbi:MAG: HI0074 family nucleotidyltransferase substrate-binding subunit [Deltaproteobacteria bacterium]|nr:HI0074 family nucleotidyltransferase substrate-binding subunit [Deltaproteobacteria bacterium]MDZ4224871.1 HI0074 family nucleotidyltransferase substrate-binding subunit [bacterium]
MAYRKKLSRTFEIFEAAAQKLKEAIDPQFQARFEKGILIEIVTKRFEYTFESMWKCLKEVLLEEGIEALSPLSCFQEAFHAGIIPKEHEAVFPPMVKKRNEIVHIYSDEDAQEIFLLIKDSFSQAIFSLLDILKSRVMRKTS